MRNDNGETIARVCEDDGHCDNPDPMPMDDNGARIADCVTALAGMDPKKLAAAIASLEELIIIGEGRIRTFAGLFYEEKETIQRARVALSALKVKR